jgi:hypothetical protein
MKQELSMISDTKLTNDTELTDDIKVTEVALNIIEIIIIPILYGICLSVVFVPLFVFILYIFSKL